MLRRLWANTLFMLAIGVAGLLQRANVPQNIAVLVLASVVVAAVITNAMLIKSTGLLGVGGLSLAYGAMRGHHPADGLLIAITILTVAAIVLMIFADFPNPSKRSYSDEISES